ncbi:GNAT family N-acetyltransferase [Aerococcus sp. UMB7834]|uniref:GNAT family N-acetyltransferase n=1 Tax=Aerococcus sp. UMB7834 TaxID=3046342 RepID=UPI0033057A08
MKSECKRLHVNGVIASSEITTKSAAELANELDLPGNKCTPYFICNNKYLMRECVNKVTQVKQPKYYLYDDKDIKDFPIMVKAVDSCGKQGISLVSCEEELQQALLEAKEASLTGEILIEGYLDGGNEYSIECISDGQDTYVVQITDKVTSGPPYFTEIAHHQPANLTKKFREKINVAAKEIIQAVGITCGMAHLELKIINDDIYFIEVGARGGGDHIADKLTVMSTDFDYYKEAIKCSLGIFQPKDINTIAYTGIYYYTMENKHLNKLFQISKNENWCVESNINTKHFKNARGNVEINNQGYFIYKSDHRISITDVPLDYFEVVKINSFDNAYHLVWNFNKKIGRQLSDKELKNGIIKFIENGNLLAVLDNNEIIALLNVYCNNNKTQEAYICNVYVLKEYRGIGIAKKLVNKAIELVKKNNFKKIVLHVDITNVKAIQLYEKLDFKVAKEDDNNQLKMVRDI